MRQEIVMIEIDKKTEIIKFDWNGFIGEGCNAMEQFEQSLGQVTDSTDKEERFNYALEVPLPVSSTE